MEEYGSIITDNLDKSNDGFSWTVATVLTGLGAETYIRLFKKHNIGKNTLVELTDEDLMQLGVDDPNIRENIIKGARSLPQYDDVLKEQIDYSQKILDCTQAVNNIRDASKQTHRLKLSVMANKVALKRDKNPIDDLVFPDQYASEIAIKTLNKMELLVEAIESHMCILGNKSKSRKKVVVGTVGGITIAILAYGFIQSLKNIY